MNDPSLMLILPAMFALLGALGGSGLTAYINRRNTVDTLTSSRRANEEQWDRSLTYQKVLQTNGSSAPAMQAT